MPRPPRTPEWVRQLPPARSEAVQEAIVAELRAAIIGGRAAPGSLIPLGPVASRFEVSRIPVREALKTLTAEGLVEHEPGEGYLVAQLTRAELSECYSVREALEGMAMRTALTRATAADDRELTEAFEALSRAIESHDSDGHHVGSRRFHLALTAPSQMHRLMHMFATAWNVTEPLRPMSHVCAEDGHELHAQHKLMLAAFLRRDLETLTDVSTQHYGLLQQIVAQIPERAGLSVETGADSSGTDISSAGNHMHGA